MRADTFLRLAKGFRGRAKNCKRIATFRVAKSLQYAYISRKLKKRDFRRLWISQINAATREHGLPYSSFIAGLVKTDIAIDRKILSDLCINEPRTFQSVVEVVKETGVRNLKPFQNIPVFVTSEVVPRKVITPTEAARRLAEFRLATQTPVPQYRAPQYPPPK